MLSIIIPAYNEEKRIIPTLKSYYEFFKSMKKELAFEILVIVNGSTDKTFQISQDYAKMKKEIKVFNLKTQYQIGCFEPPGLKLTHYLQRKARTSFSSLRQFQARTHETTLWVALRLPA